MSTTDSQTPTGLDTPITSITEVTPDDYQTRETKPDADQDQNPTTSSGAEQVEGYHSLSDQPSRAPELATLEDWESLPDIAIASYGAVAKTVHGPDDRVQITNTATYPWSAVASLLITAADNSRWIGTGWFIGRHTLMTAGHVVYIKNSGVPGRDGFVKSIQVVPGRDGTKMPFGSVTSINNFRTVAGWANNGSEEYDYGAIIIPTDLGAQTGTFGFGVYNDATLVASVGNITGYPGDKPAGTQWYASRKIDSVATRKVYYDIDTAGGQSGSAVYRIVNGQRFAFAVHAYGGAVTNSGTRIVNEVYNNMRAWLA